MSFSGYKRVEERAAQAMGRAAGGMVAGFVAFLRSIVKSGRLSLTIMLVPHSHNRIFHFRVSVFTLIFFFLLFIGSLSALVVLSAVWTEAQRVTAQSIKERDEVLASIQALQTEIGELRRLSRVFEQSLGQTLDAIGLNRPTNQAQGGGSSLGDLMVFQGLDRANGPALWELNEMRNLRLLISESIEPLEEIGNVLKNQRRLIQGIPSLWPVQNGLGWMTFPFGPAIHPFTGRWYTHTGIDIAHQIGTPIIATANGIVRKVEYDVMGYGIHVEIEHSYGFSTLYAHLQRAYVTKGQRVSRGQVIGALGSTGQSTGPHLHYEVRIAKQVVDPANYINIGAGLRPSR